MPDELKPCPMCGSPAHLLECSLGFYVQCTGAKCDIENAYHNWTAKRAVEIWNTRAIESALRAQLDEAVGLLRKSKSTTLCTYKHPTLAEDIHAFVARFDALNDQPEKKP